MGRARNPDYVRFVEAVYDLDASDEVWLGEVARALPASLGFDGDLGSYGLRYDASGSDIRFAGLQIHGMNEAVAELMTVTLPRLWATNPQWMEVAFHRTASGPARDIPFGHADELLWPAIAGAGVADVFGLNGINPSRRGVHVGFPLGTVLRARGVAARATWDRMASHLAAADRLRQRIQEAHTSALDSADAILRTDGEIEDARNVDVVTARTALRSAVRAIERARGKERRRDPDESLARWRALASARWTVVDHFESDGKRYLLAERNDPETAPILLLTPRERQVVALVSMGCSNKLIAYELGIATSTVSVLIGRAQRRLGATSRAALAEAYRRAASSPAT